MSNCTNCQDKELNSTYENCVECADNKNKCNFEIDSACVVYHPNDDKPTRLDALNMPNKSTAEQIFEAINDLIGTGMNLPLVEQDTNSINITTWGVAKHHLRADLKISSDANNIAEIRNNGLYVPSADGIANANNGLNLSGDTVKLGGNLLAATTITTTSSYTLTLAGLVDNTDTTFISSNSGGRLSKRTLTNSITSNVNTLTSTVFGLSDDTTIITSNTLTIDGSGNLVSTINGVSTSVGIPITPVLTASNGLNISVNDVMLGGVLTDHTAITKSSSDYNLGIDKLVVGVDAVSSFLTTNDFSLNVYKIFPNNGGVSYNSSLASKFVLSSTNSFVINNQIGTHLVLNYSNNTTYSSSKFITNNYAALTLEGNTQYDLTFQDASNNSKRMASVYSSQISFAQNSATANAVLESVAGFYGMGVYAENNPVNPVTITNYYGMYLCSSNHGSTGRVINRFGIYQEGESDLNVINGEIQLGDTGRTYANGGFLTTSTTNTVNKKLKIKIDGIYYYILLSTSAT